MRFACLGSGSRGNAFIVEHGSTRLMLDCGFRLEETVRRLERCGIDAESLSAIIVTHEHADHVSGVARFARTYRVPVYLTYGTLVATGAVLASAEVRKVMIDGHSAFAIGDLEVFPLPVPHDAREPVQFVFGDGVHRLGILTDTGCATAHIEAMLSGLDALVLECNHDEEMLRDGSYPPTVKHRISGRLGHLANRAAAELLARLDATRLQHVIAAHLSQQNNRASLARTALADVLGCNAEWIGVADQEEGLCWRSL